MPLMADRPLPWLQDDRHSLLLGGMVWVLIVMMIVPDGFDYQALVDITPPGPGGAISRALWLGLLLLALTLLARRAKLAWLVSQATNPFVILFLMLAVASLVWSIDPPLTLRRLIRLGTIVAVCFAFVMMGWHARRLQNVVRPVLTLVLLGSLLFGLAAPSLAIHHEQASELSGAWRGLANHKNSLGAIASMALVFWFHGALTREVKWTWAVAGISVSMACLLLSRSTTALGATLFVMGLLLVLVFVPQRARSVVPLFVYLLLAALLAYALAILDIIPGLDTLLAPVQLVTGKNATLSGRTEIWAIISEHMRAHPWFGTGFDAYWTASPVVGTDSYEFTRRMGTFYPGSAHNGYLEIANDLGRVGLGCVLAYMVFHVRHALRLYRVEPGQAALLLAILFQQGVTNLSETHWFGVLSVDFVVMTLATAALARAGVEHRLRATLGQPQGAVPRTAPALGVTS